MGATETMLNLYVDLDAHTVFSQIFRMAQRYRLELYVVTADFWHVDEKVHLIAAQEDDLNSSAWIAANISRGDICVTSDPNLATNCLLRGARALSPAGRFWSGDAINETTIGAAANPQACMRALEGAILAGRSAGRGALGSLPGFPRAGLAATASLGRAARG
jgi:uncharacterized protein YaiI (UPF0178 family)